MHHLIILQKIDSTKSVKGSSSFLIQKKKKKNKQLNASKFAEENGAVQRFLIFSQPQMAVFMCTMHLKINMLLTKDILRFKQLGPEVGFSHSKFR